MSKRIFLSIDLPDQIKARLQFLQRPEIRPVKWMKTGNFHITLNFLGELSDEDVEKAAAISEEVAGQTTSFNLTLDKFRSERDMLWLLPQPNADLLNLQEALKERLREGRIGKRERRDYSPHILFAKTKTGRRFEWRLDDFDPFTFTAGRINLYESKLTPETATHILIHSFDLQ